MASVKIIGKVAVKVMPDTSDFKNDLKKKLNAIEKSIGDMKVDVVPQINKAAEKRVQAQMAALQKKLDNKKVNFNAGVNLRNSEVTATEAALAFLTRKRTVNVGVDFDGNSIGPIVDKFLMLGGARPQIDGLRESLRQLGNMDYLALGAATLSTKVTLLGGAALAATGHLFSLGSDLLSIVRAGIALPGILGGIVIGLGTTAAAFADFNKYVPQAKTYMQELQNVISGNFWDQASSQINKFVDGVFPVLVNNLSTTGAALGNFFGEFAESLGTSLNPALKGMFTDLKDSIDIATGSTGSFANIIKVLGEVGAGQLPGLATWFSDISDRFSTFLTKAQADGTLDAWIERGKTNLIALGGVLKNTYDIFGGIAQAARDAGGITLPGLSAALAGISETVNSSAFQEGLTKVFETAYKMMDRLTNQAGPGLKAMILSVADIFNAVGPGLAKAIGGVIGALGTALSDPAVQSSALTFFAGITTAIQNIKPAIDPIVAIFTSLGPVFAALLENISMIATQGIDKLAPTITGIMDAIVPVIDNIGSLISKVMEDLTPVFQTVGENVAILIEKMAPLLTALQDLWNLVSPVLVPALNIVADIIGSALAGAINGITNIITGFVTFIKGFIDLFKAIFTGDWQGIWDAALKILSGAWDMIKGVIEVALNIGILGVVRKGWQAIKGIFTSAGSSLKTITSELWSSIKGNASTLWDQITVMPSVAFSAIIKFVKGIAGDLKAAASLAWEAIVTAATTQFKLLYTIFTELPGKIKGFLVGAATMLTDIGGQIVQSLIDGVQAAFGKVKAKFQELTDMIPDWKGPYSRDKVLLKPVGALIIDSLINGLESRYKGVGDSLKGLTNDIENSLTGGSDYRVGLAASLDTSAMDLSAVKNLGATVGASLAAPAASNDQSGNVQIDNITIPLEDLAQLKTLEEFLDMLRVRTRQGVLNG